MTEPPPAPVTFGVALSSLRLDMLHAAVVLADELHYRRAADRLHLSPSGLSRRVQQLERLLDAQLFHRNSRGVTLTGDGEIVLPLARAVLVSAEQLRTALPSAREPLAG
jgi:DNA-binding transcriptional LysR family regulator